RFDGDIVLQGTLAPGFPGVDETTTKDHFGTLTFAPMHTFECDIENTPIAFFDRLVGNGDVNLAGTLEVDQLNGYVPMLGNEFQIITAGSVTGRFDTVVAPALPAPLVWKVIYRPTIVSLHATCPADITTDGTSDGVPDGAVTLSDFSFYLSLWSAGNPDADVTTDGSSNGIPDGAVTLSDFSFYLSPGSSGCPEPCRQPSSCRTKPARLVASRAGFIHLKRRRCIGLAASPMPIDGGGAAACLLPRPA
ncbi:MAG: GC-type dockerin domain-anchored protein, partial [Planctomycetota bacterium]